MGDSRFEFSTKFRFPEYMWHLSNIHKHIDFSIAKNANLPSKSQWDETWDFVSKFQKLKFCQKWFYLRQISCRYHLSTLEITSWSKNPKIFFKPLKALCIDSLCFCWFVDTSSQWNLQKTLYRSSIARACSKIWPLESGSARKVLEKC